MVNSQPPAKKQRTEGGLGKATALGEDTDPTLKKKNPSKKKKKVTGRISESPQFLRGNYRGALQEHLQREGDFKLIFETEEKNQRDPKAQKTYVSICSANNITAKGEAKSKKQAVHFASLAAMKMLKLISAAEYKRISKRVKKEEEIKVASKVAVAKKTKEQLYQEREIDEEETTYTGTVKLYIPGAAWGFISISEEITFKDITTTKKVIYVSKDDIVCYSEEVGLNKNTKVIFKVYKDSKGLGAYEVQNEDGTPISFDPKIDKSDKPKDGTVVKRKKKKKIGQMIENKQYLAGNYRGAFQEYLSKKYPEAKVEFETELQEPATNVPVFISTCKVLEGENERLNELVGTGHAPSKKSSVQFSALDFMLKLNLLSAKQHSKIHRQNKDGTATGTSQ